MTSGTSGVQPSRWVGRPVASRLVRIGILLVPFAAAMATAFVLSGMFPTAMSNLGNVARWVAIVAVSTGVMRLVDGWARRLVPLSTLLSLTLVFPDQAPSRFEIAMRTGTTRDLERRITEAREARVGETETEAAERLLELVGLLSHHDRLTRGHSERVRAYAHMLGSEMGLTGDELDRLRWAALLHDVGKTAIPSEILNKPGKLTDEEFEAIKAHPAEGWELVAPLSGWLGESLRAVLEHHERFDGRGYPAGLAGTDISMAARIVSVADTYDVITSARSYKAPLPAAQARAELARCSGSQFDPVVVRAFLNLSLGRLRLMTGPLAWLAQFALFEPTGVVHAGATPGGGGVSVAGTGGASSAGAAASTAGSAGVGTAATTAATTAASSAAGGAASAVAATGGASVASLVSTTAAVTMGVASGAAGIAVAGDDDRYEPMDAAIVVEVEPPTSLATDPADEQVALAAPTGIFDALVAMEPEELPADAPPLVVTEPAGESASAAGGANGGVDGGVDGGDVEMPTTSGNNGVVEEEAGDGAADEGSVDEGDASESDVEADPQDGVSTQPVSTGIDAPGQSGEVPGVTAPGQSGEVPGVTAPGQSGEVPGVTAPGQSGEVPGVTAPGQSASTTTTTPTTVPTTTPTTTTTTVPTTTPTTVPTTTPTTTTTTVPTTTPTTTTPTTVPNGAEWGDKLYLGAPLVDTFSLADYGLTTVAPPDTDLVNLDTDRDAFPGLLVQKDSAGPGGTDPVKVAVFSEATVLPFVLDGDVEVHLHVAAKDFEKDDINVGVQLRHCSVLGSCTMIAEGDKEAKNAQNFKTVSIKLKDVEQTFVPGDRLELRVAALDDSENDMWLAFGTKHDHGWIKFD